MEWNKSKLKADRNHHEGEPSQPEERLGAVGRHSGANFGKDHGPGLKVQERHAEQKKGRGGGREQQILERGFQRSTTCPQIADQAVQRDADQLQSQKKWGEVHGRRENESAERGN